jgi:hypothetical protein
MRKFLFVSFIILTGLSAFAQRFAGHPPGTRWKQINTDTVRVIFPSGFERQAADVVATAHALGYRTQGSIGNKLRKISIVLQPRTTITNGYVALGPWRSEFMLTPNQNSFELGALPWHRFLALHEYRHIQQYTNFNKGVSKAFSFLFGQDGLSLATSAAVPNWFWEGDAVYQETLMSTQGRGRLPYFHNEFRSLWMANKNYSWMKLRNGSLRDFVPDHYKLGYMMVAYGREKYGEEFWKKVTDDAVRYKGLFYPFQRAVKKYSGKDYKTFRAEALSYFEQNSDKNDENDVVSQWAQGKKHFADNEEYPQWIDENNILYVRSSYRRIPAFYIREVVSGQSRKLRVKDISLDNYFSYRNSRVAYAAYEPDRLWNWIDFSVIKVLDISTGEQRTLTHRSHYFSPDISEDGKEVVAVQVLPGGDASLHIIDAGSGAVIHQLPNPQQLFYTYPKFYIGNTIVSAVRNSAGQMSLALINRQSGAVEEELFPFSYNVIGFPMVRGDTITFTASHNGKDELFAYIGKELFRVNTAAVNSGTGNYQVSMFNDKAAFTAFTAAGFHMQVLTKPELMQVSNNELADAIPDLGVASMKVTDTLALPASKAFSATPYSKGFRLFNFHSWRPYISDPDYSFSILSENVLNTLQTELYFNYNRNEKFKQAGVSMIYGGIFPYISASVYGTFERLSADTISAFNWNEYDGRLGLTAPINFTSGRTYKTLSFAAGINHKQVNYTGVAKTRYDDVRFNYIDLSSSFSIQSQQARMHIYPRLGNSFFARYRAAINELTARQMLVNNSLYLPGIDQTHNLVISAAWQGRDTMLQYVFPNSFPFSRGYTNVNSPRMWKIGVNYHLPLLYPDWGFGNIVYFLRVRGNAFYDHSQIKSLRTGAKFNFRSTGAEIFFDTKWWNEYEVTFGIRYSQLADGALLGQGPHQWEFILPVNLLGR